MEKKTRTFQDVDVNLLEFGKKSKEFVGQICLPSDLVSNNADFIGRVEVGEDGQSKLTITKW